MVGDLGMKLSWVGRWRLKLHSTEAKAFKKCSRSFNLWNQKMITRDNNLLMLPASVQFGNDNLFALSPSGMATELFCDLRLYA